MHHQRLIEEMKTIGTSYLSPKSLVVHILDEDIGVPLIKSFCQHIFKVDEHNQIYCHVGLHMHIKKKRSKSILQCARSQHSNLTIFISHYQLLMVLNFLIVLFFLFLLTLAIIVLWRVRYDLFRLEGEIPV